MFWLRWAVQFSALTTQSASTFAGGSSYGKIIYDKPIPGGVQEDLNGEAVPIHFVLLSTLNPPWARDQFRNAVQGHSLKDVKMPDLRRLADWKPGEADLQEAEHRRAWKSAVEQEPGTWTIIVEDARGFAKVLAQDGADYLKAGLSKNKNQPGSSGSWVDFNRDCKAPGKPLGYAVSPRSAAMLLVLGRKPEPVRDTRSQLVTQGRLSEGCVSIASSTAWPTDEEEDDFYDGGAESIHPAAAKDAHKVVGKSQFLPVADDRSLAMRDIAVARRSDEGSDIRSARPIEIGEILMMLLQVNGVGWYFLLGALLVLLTCGICAIVYMLPPEAIRAKIGQARQSVSGSGARLDSPRHACSGSDHERKPHLKQAFKGNAIDANE